MIIQRIVHIHVVFCIHQKGTGQRETEKTFILSTGKRIERARKAKGLTQAQLGSAIGKTKSAIGNYEQGTREPNAETLQAIAEALDVAPTSLVDHGLDTVQDVLEVLFQMEEAGFGIEPVSIGSAVAIAVDPSAPHAPKLEMALEKWAQQLEAVKKGELSEYEYAFWRGSFGTDSKDEEDEGA